MKNIAFFKRRKSKINIFFSFLNYLLKIMEKVKL